MTNWYLQLMWIFCSAIIEQKSIEYLHLLFHLTLVIVFFALFIKKIKLLEVKELHA